MAPANQPPVVTNPGNQSNAEGAIVSLAIVANDPDGNGLSYSASGLPTGLNIDPLSGQISGSIAAGAAGGSPYAVTVTVTDDGTPPLSTNVQFIWTVTGGTSQNLLSDPGFENGGQGWQQTTASGRSIVTTEAHTGTHSQQMVVDRRRMRDVFQDVAVVGGTTYNASGWVKTSGLGGDGARIELLWMDANGSVLQTDRLGTLIGTNNWTLLASPVTAPATAATVRFRLATFSDPDRVGTAWFDDNMISP